MIGPTQVEGLGRLDNEQEAPTRSRLIGGATLPDKKNVTLAFLVSISIPQIACKVQENDEMPEISDGYACR